MLVALAEYLKVDNFLCASISFITNQTPENNSMFQNLFFKNRVLSIILGLSCLMLLPCVLMLVAEILIMNEE